MCGIAGIIKTQKSALTSNDLNKMLKSMHHRGPDAVGTFHDENAGLSFGFVRLAIIDLTVNSNQPFISQDGNYVMIYNGEIFNYLELKTELETLGHIFTTKSDTEVLLHAFIEWGKDCLEKFNGMWAFAIYDKQRNSVFLARDRYGIKPLYFYSNSDEFIFSSEINGILQIPSVERKPNFNCIYDFLVFNRTSHNTETFFENIIKLNHGDYMTIDLNSDKLNYKTYNWYDLRKEVQKATPFENQEEFRDLLVDSIKIRLRSDVPVGVCLSGGLDSSVITSVLIKTLNVNDLNTFSSVYGKEFRQDESNFINCYSNELGERFYVSTSAEDLLKDLETFVNIHSEPIPSTSPYVQYRVLELAGEHVKVTLDGQGADELLGGYHYMTAFYYKELFTQFKWLRLLKEIKNYYKLHKSLTPLSYLGFSLIPNKLKNYLAQRNSKFVNQSFIKRFKNQSTIANDLYNVGNFKDCLLNHFEFKLEHLLKWADINSMKHSVEARIPFLDFRLVHRTLASTSMLYPKNGITKSILRESFKDILPEKIKNRVDKIGFETPQDEWFRNNQFKKVIDDLVNSESFKAREIFDVNNIKKIVEDHFHGKSNNSNNIWKCLHLELWFRVYIDNQENLMTS
jgi:asparagine synthase (glutamine-hydrolysing)